MKGEPKMKAIMRDKSFELLTPNNYFLPDNQKEIFTLIRESRIWYPDILDWYYNIFSPEFFEGSRIIVVCQTNNQIAGIALLKNDSNENKICSFRVKNRYRNNGIGKTLFGKCLEALNDDRPMITVPTENLNYFKTILRYYDFRLEQIAKDYYRNSSIEYVFNGYLDSKKLSYNSYLLQ